uniref:Uncharacterized protein n=1 Tax=Anguilla anguilla TaxID=7936 RepID=A0A0E9UKC3_ANGAN
MSHFLMFYIVVLVASFILISNQTHCSKLKFYNSK